MNASHFRTLATKWRSEVQLYRHRGMDAQASMTESLTAELEAAIQEWDEEALTLTEASKEAGYTPDHLGRLVRDGKIPNAGFQNAPRIRRRDLPMKAPKLHPGTTSEHLGSTKTEIVRSVVSSEGASDE